MRNEKLKTVLRKLLSKKHAALFLAVVLTLGLIAPAGSLLAYAKQSWDADVRFWFQNPKGALSSVKIQITKVEEEPEPEEPPVTEAPPITTEEPPAPTEAPEPDPTSTEAPPEDPEPGQYEQPAPDDESAEPAADPAPRSPQIAADDPSAVRGEVVFEGESNYNGLIYTELSPGKYHYKIIQIPDNYIMPENAEGDFEINEDEYDKEFWFTVYAEKPTLELQPSEDHTYGAEFSLRANAQGVGQNGFTYKWKKGEEVLTGKNSSELRLSPLTMEDGGVYSCEVTSPLCDPSDNIQTASYTLTVEPAEPVISFEFDPVSGKPYQNGGTKIRVSVSHAREQQHNVNGIDNPSGTVVVEIRLEGQEEILHQTETPLSLGQNGQTERISFPLRSGKYTVTARFDAGENANYTNAEQSVSYEIVPRQGGTDDYVTSDPVRNNEYYFEYGQYCNEFVNWYNAAHPFTIKPSKNAPYDKIRFSGQSEEYSQITVENQTTGAGGRVSFQLVDSASGETADYDLFYKMDNELPTVYPVTLIDGTDHVHGLFSGADNVGIAYFKLYFKYGQTIIEQAHNNQLDHRFLNSDEYIGSSLYTSDRLEYYTAIDLAGNESEKREVTIKRIEVEVSREENAARTQTEAYHHSPVKFEISVYNGRPAEENVVVNLNGESVEDLTWEYVAGDDEQDSEDRYVALVETPDKEGTYQLEITAPESMGYLIKDDESADLSEASYMLLREGVKYSSLIHIIDKTDPALTVEYDPETPANGQTAYPDRRDAYVLVTEEHFDKTRLTIPLETFTVTDINGVPLYNVENPEEKAKLDALRAALEEILQNGDWEESGEGKDTVYKSPALTFDQDGVYSFTIVCTDKANNEGAYTEEEAFVIDHEAPKNLTVSYDTKAVNIVLETLTFGFYDSDVTVVVTAQDDFSGVARFDITYTPQAGTYSKNDVLETIPQERLTYSHDGATTTATFTLTADEYRQYRGSLSFTATDGAGNQSEPHSGEGFARDTDEPEDMKPTPEGKDVVFVIDTFAPTLAVTLPEPQQLRKSADMTAVAGGWKKLPDTEKNTTDYILYYNHNAPADIPVKLEIVEANFYPEDVDVKVNGNGYQVAWKQEEADRPLNRWTGEVHLQADGYYRIAVNYRDRSGNVMKPYESNLIVIDRTAPTVDRYEFNPATSDGEGGTDRFIEQLEYGYYFKTDFAVTVYSSDPAPSAELNTLTYRLISYKDGKLVEEQTQTTKISGGKAFLTIPSGFKGQICAVACDYADNASPEVTPQGLVVDQNPPSIEIVTNESTPYSDGSGNRLYTETMTFTVTVRDTVSGLREIGWLQNAELRPTERSTTFIPNTGVSIGSTLGDGWVVAAMDRNLVTEVRRTFTYAEDDNDIALVVDATDRSANRRSDVRGETVTVDKTAPVIAVTLTGGHSNGIYYNEERTATVTVTERNFDAARITADIKNSFGEVPGYAFNAGAGNVYTATIRFQEGNYTFAVSGTDRGNHPANVTYAGGNEREFVIDLTDPVVVTNFATFANEAKNNFTQDKTVEITIKEHNFDKNLTGLHIYQKKAGESLDNTGMTDITAAVLRSSDWNSRGDEHSFSFKFTEEAVYMVTLAPVDLADRTGGEYSTVVFEIDKTEPVISKRNDTEVKPDSVEFLDIYGGDRKDDPAPTVTFFDTHIDHIEYEMTVWVPNYSDMNEYPRMIPQTDRGEVQGDTFTLEHFEEDGIYTVRLTAVDIAGNRSAENVNTYVRLVEKDILAFIADSNAEKKTGLFSFQDQENNPISLRPDGFNDLTVMVYAKSGTEAEVLLRDTNGDEVPIGELQKTDSCAFGMDAYTYLVPASRFVDLYQDDADTTLFLTVRDGEDRIDLGVIHIDNIIPECTMPDGFRNWKWYFGNEPRTFTITNISEELDWEKCAVYDNGTELPYTYDSAERTISFELSEGWHNVGVVLRDLAGNTNNVQEVQKIHIGLFWLWIIIGGTVLLGGLGTFLGIRAKRKKTEVLDD